jgi:drug/metabolite transporter (DMT)-like permease
VIGLILALLSGTSFSVSNVYIRRGVHRSGETFSLIPIFAFIGTAFFILPVFIWGDVGQLASLSWLGLSALAGAGVVHFVLGRITGYSAIRLIGANRAVPIFSGSILIAALWGIFLLGELLTLSRAVAILLIIGGIILISTTGDKEAGKLGMPRGSLVSGVLLALGAALCWGTTPLLVKIGLREINSPLLATFISYVAASIVIGFTLFYPANRGKLRRLDRASLIPIIIAAIAVSVAQILRYNALLHSPVSLVEPLVGSTNNLLVFPLSFLVNRQIEAFNPKIIVGAIAIVVGVFLIFWVA